MTDRVTCECFIEGGKMCSPCFVIWYDSGITNAEHLYAERKAREDNGYWPFGKGVMPMTEIREIGARFGVSS